MCGCVVVVVFDEVWRRRRQWRRRDGGWRRRGGHHEKVIDGSQGRQISSEVILPALAVLLLSRLLRSFNLINLHRPPYGYVLKIFRDAVESKTGPV